MEQWKVNLGVLWAGLFLVMAGMTMIMPFMALYLKQDFGMTNEHEVATWAGLIFASNFVTAFIAQPIWGKLSDRYGRKMMLLRSGFGMAIVITLMGFATSPWQLLVLRMLNGTISGFNPAAISLASATVPKERMGFAMGILQSGTIAGTILGPFLGGLMADAFGFRPIFYITGACLFLASLLAMFTVRESFDRAKAAAIPQVSVLQGLRELSAAPQLFALFAVTFLIQFAMMSPQPLIALFVEDLLGPAVEPAFWAGLVGAVTGMSNMAAAPLLGRMSDRVGAEKVLIVSIIGAALLFIPQAFVGDVWSLIAVRFVQGVFIGGMVPTVNALVRKYTPDGMESRAYSFNTSTLSLGNMIGPIVGGAVSGPLGIQGVFLMSAVFLLANGWWVWNSLMRRRPVRPAVREDESN